jgi:hypothetical protein
LFTFTASQTKQNFGALIGQLAQGTVAIERHHQTVAIVMLPELARSVPDPRQAARAAQQQRELHRLMRHQQLAINLLCASAQPQQDSLQAAQRVVDRWQAEQLSSADYIQRWRDWLTRPVPDLARLMCGEADGRGAAMRQNSPFMAISPGTTTA